MQRETTKKRPERGRAAQGARTRDAILRVAVDLASAEGLEGLTIGRLSTELGMSKSGLFAHFGSKEELQLATVEYAREVFVAEVVEPVGRMEDGLDWLWRIFETWLDYARGEVFRGGCFFAAAAAEFDNRPGPVRDLIASIMGQWLDLIERAIRRAQEQGHIDPSVDARQLVFEMNALAMGSNWEYQLFGRDEAFDRARVAVLGRLRSVALPGAPIAPTSTSREEAP